MSLKTDNSRQKEMVCIACPIGCRLTVTKEDDDIHVSGNKCQRGQIYAREEWFSPKRMVTTTCLVTNSTVLPRVPVRSTEAIPVEYINKLLSQLHELEITAPLPAGSVIMENIEGTGIDIITSHTI